MGDDDMADLLRTAASALQRRGVPNAEELARGIVADLRKELGGQSFYVSKAYDQRNAEIKSAFNGRNADELAARHGISKSRVLQIANGW
jgi:Mor family transcriptional regulator